MIKIVMMTGVAVYLLGFGVYVIIYTAGFMGEDMDYIMYKFVEGLGFGLAWPYLLFGYLVHGTPMM